MEVCAKGGDKEHECFKNWSESSYSMESNIILERFRMTEKYHSVCYINFIDSSVQSRLRENVYGWGHDITMQECANHSAKCFRSSLENLVKTNPYYKGRHKLTKSMHKRLASSARCTIIMRSKDVAEKKLIMQLLLNIYRMTKSHHKCKADYCKTVQQLNSIQKPTTA